ncbi:MAG: branched-chain amino acid ABC transporter permease [Syntrophobacteraceae bacterium]|jgi:branched-chain amino acid transport system permease protein|nr:branched-chain amino acid ABC transporter permease [Syntrophobacteraceae bacterium]
MDRKHLVPLLILCAFLIAFPWVVTPFKAVSHYLDIMVFAGIFSMVTLGLSMLMGYAGQISLAQAAFFGIGAYTSGILTSRFGWSPLAAMPFGILLSGGVAWLVGIPALRLKGHYLAMATLGFGVIVHIILSEEVDWTGGPSGMVDIPGLQIGSWKLTSDMGWYYLIWGVVVLLMIFCFNILGSRMGRALRAIHEEERAAEAMGVPTARYKVQVFILGAAFAALAGSFYTHYVTFLNPASFNLMWSIRFVLMVMMGGMQSLWGAIIGTVLMTFVGNEWLHHFAELEIVVYGAILLIVALFLPSGLISLPGLLKRSSGPASPKGSGHE